jgi:hypothetical protein
MSESVTPELKREVEDALAPVTQEKPKSPWPGCVVIDVSGDHCHRSVIRKRVQCICVRCCMEWDCLRLCKEHYRTLLSDGIVHQNCGGKVRRRP